MAQIQNGEYLETWDGDVLVSSVIHRPIVPTRRDEIISALAEIDQKSDSPRARREAALGNTTWLASLNTQALALRAELAALK
ncbi:MAG: hypothetical protein A3E01_00165 [Gammaproteobacteria bacterium RIFCSPHIGHO2_12_FULL_63_22]|nr:MAG: hypothetical protein A3E01_00165 [Gammaproteobacteria bacterium RIFCSPHIGHO2_12_FULL_63_22]